MGLIIRLITILLIFELFWNCNSSKPKKSLEDIKVAYSNETTASEKYAKYAQAAMNEGFDTLAQLFTAVSKSERIHATNIGKVIEKFGVDGGNNEQGNFSVKSTAENLKEAIKSETFDMQTVYPGFIREAEQEKLPEIARSFTWAWESEKRHLKYFRKANSVIINGKETNLPFVWYVCSLCGGVYNKSDVKDKCEYCLTRQENFIGFVKQTE